MENIDLSIVIPTWNRSKLLDRLLHSLDIARSSYKYGKTEVLIVDSSQGEEKEMIQHSCEQYNACYLQGPDNVRKKRNMGIMEARFPIIVFFDSDVTVDENILNLHAKTYLESTDSRIGGTFGVTEFVGEENFIWKIVKYTTFTDSFSFAKRFPYQNWTIGNNVSFKKSVLEEINMFEEAFPFKLGGDDLDMSYRVTKNGYRIKSVPDAVTWHAKETWSHLKAINDRTKRWGSMEYYLSRRHPEIFITSGLKTELLWTVIMIIALLFTCLFRSPRFLLGSFLFILLSFVSIFIMDARESHKWNIVFYGLSKWFEARYYFFHIIEGIKHGTLDGLHKTMSFSFYQTRAMLVRESRKVWILMLTLVICWVSVLLV